MSTPILTAVIGLLAHGLCVAAPDQPVVGPLRPESGRIVGRALTAGGRPVPAFTVSYSGFEDGKLADQNAGGDIIENVHGNAKGKDGRYSIKVPSGAYRVSAYVTYEFTGRIYNFELSPTNWPARHDYNGLGLDILGAGIVRDFTSQMTGKIPEAPEDGETFYETAYRGGLVKLDARQANGVLGGGLGIETPLRNAYPPESTVEISLTPTGPLVDGTTGQPVTASLPLGLDGRYTFSVRGVPPGNYAATGRLKAPGAEGVPLRLSLTPGQTILKGAGDYDKVVVNWQPSVTVDFLPTDSGPPPHFGVKPVTLYLGK